MIWDGDNVIILEIKCTVSVTGLNHPETIFNPPPWSMEKLSSTKLFPGAQKFGDHCFRASWGLSRYWQHRSSVLSLWSGAGPQRKGTTFLWDPHTSPVWSSPHFLLNPRDLSLLGSEQVAEEMCGASLKWAAHGDLVFGPWDRVLFQERRPQSGRMVGPKVTQPSRDWTPP